MKKRFFIDYLTNDDLNQIFFLILKVFGPMKMMNGLDYYFEVQKYEKTIKIGTV